MVNYPYPTNFLAPLPGFPVRQFCSKINNGTDDILVELSNALLMYTNSTGKTKCNDIAVTSKDLGEAGWDFQVSYSFSTKLILIIPNTKFDIFPQVFVK